MSNISEIQPAPTETISPAPQTKRALALAWAARGFPVFPLAPNSKLPLAGSKGHLEATTDFETIKSWWSDPITGESLDFNIGTSPRDGRHLIVDLDEKAGRNGIANYIAMGGEVAGLVVETPTGGLHVYYTTTEPLRTAAGRLAPGIDTRGPDGYVLAPGSTIDGVTYEVILDHTPRPLPSSIAELIGTCTERDVLRAGRVLYRQIEDDQPANLRRAIEVARLHPPAITGTWHELGFRLGAELCRVAISPETAIEVAEAHWVPRGTGYASRDRFVADLTGGYDTALKDGEHGRNAVPDPAEAFAGVVLPPVEPTPPASTALVPANADLARRQEMYVERGDLRNRLECDRDRVLPILANIHVILKNEPLLRSLVVLDSFTGRVVIVRPPPVCDRSSPLAPGPYPREMRDDDQTRILTFLQQTWDHDFRASDLANALEVEARDNAFHPVTEWLATLQWDGVGRLEKWLCRGFGAAETPYHAAIACKWLIAAVRRVRQPGCKFDYLPVLQGSQGIGKSRALAVLFGQAWFTDRLPDDLSSRDAAESMAGKWCIELGEITQLVRSGTETVKAFLSRSVDRYRLPYAKRSCDVPRQCVLIGTTNPGEYLRDPTGNRRFWPITCGTAPADIDWLAANREQLWAEAAHREALGVSIWLDEEVLRREAEAAQAAQMEEDVWEPRVLAHLRSLPTATTKIGDVLLHGLSIDVAHHDKRAQMRVANIMRAAGWVRVSAWDATIGRTGWVWRAPADWPVHTIVSEEGCFDPPLTTSSPPPNRGGEAISP